MLPIDEAIARAQAHAPFLRMQLDGDSPVAAAVRAGDLPAALAAARAEEGGMDVAAALRRARAGHALALAIGDLAGRYPLEIVIGELSALADRCLGRALEAALAERCPGEQVRGFAIVALGKLGGDELNYSSDVDLLMVFDPAILPRRAREEPGQAAVRTGQRIVQLLQERTADGYAFRVDLRLRPAPEVTPIVLPVDAAISYYESSALPWERAAFIRARHAAGDPTVGYAFLEAIHPFVWRRGLDFGALGEIQSMSAQIRDHYADRQRFGPGFDLKRGRGGIRDVEFIAQAHQLIHGGRDPMLRTRGTLPALAALAAAGRIDGADAAALAAAYRLLRTIEHRVQMIDDRQTHQLPAERGALDAVACLHGLSDGTALLALIEPHVAAVTARSDALAPPPGPSLPRQPSAVEEGLAALGFPAPAAAAARIERWRGGQARSLRAPAARLAFEAMLPGLIEALGRAPDPQRALNRFDDLVERLPSGVNFYRLLGARPALAAYLTDILSHAPALAEQLGRRPELFDGLIDASAFDPVPSVADLAAAFARAERPGEDYQLLLDRVRAEVNGARFALGVQLVLARSDPLAVAAGYARVAEAAIAVLAGAAIADFARKHGVVPGCELVILGLGRLGGGALTHASDLDLVYLFTGSHQNRSDGARSLGATDYFNRLGPRVSAALSVATAAGPLYDVDLRMRPSGRDGLLAVSLASFAAYQADAAWTFEHMALARARPVFGTAAARAEAAAVIDAILRRRREPATVAADAARMRAEITRHKPARGAFDIKLGEGGLVDLEFLVQTLQLSRQVGLTPDLGAAIDALIAAGLVPPALAEAYSLLTRMLVTLRLVAPDGDAPSPPSRQLVATACGQADWDALLAAHGAARQSVAAAWRAARAVGEGEPC